MSINYNSEPYRVCVQQDRIQNAPRPPGDCPALCPASCMVESANAPSLVPNRNGHFGILIERELQMQLRQTVPGARFRLYLIVLMAVAAATREASAQQADHVEAFIADQERAIDLAKQKLLGKIDAEAKDVRKAKLDPDAKRRMLDAIAKDREAFLKDNRMPNCDELLRVVISCVDDFQKVAERVESTRARWADQALRLDDPTAMARLDAIEKRLESVRLGRQRFLVGSMWSGVRVTDNNSLQLKLTLDELTGDDFRGKLEQTGNFGRSDLMNVAGKLQGFRIWFETTGMIRGQYRKLIFNGCLLSDRIVADLSGTSVSSKSLSGSVSLRCGK